ncbi:MAG TPA: serine/threonine-protein kinase, partial [Candidatus Polarisedimenticolia bacterium]|nr:serine/threonine-protein kinase [Candidatus Polarisedimenticolia bacterium]
MAEPRLPASDLWPRLEAILRDALDREPAKRDAWLREACGGDARLEAAARDILAADTDAGSFLGAPVELSILQAAAADAAGAADGGGAATPHVATAEHTTAATDGRIGAYRILREIGRGGMGVVYEAEQQQPRRSVALKVILGGAHVDAETVRMFRREAESLARLKHPAIAAIYESGSTDAGQHFFAMELVQGRSLAEHLDEEGPPTTRDSVRRRLALFLKIGAGVAYAHQRGVIHRDLKPSNIFVLPRAAGAAQPISGATGTGAADAPDVKILDFGLARITDPDTGANAATALTELGRVQGTLPYMSPEQVRGRRDEIDVRTDVYSLGVLLYRMLAGRLPYDVERVSLPEAARIICDTPPRSLLSTASGAARFDRDVEIIVLKALEKDPARRYPTVAALDEDVARYLTGQPILARPASAVYQLSKLVARHKAPFAAAATLVVGLAGTAVAMTVQAGRIAAARDRANREATTARSVSDFLTGLFKVSDPNEARGNVITAREILDQGAARIDRDLGDQPEVQAGLMLTLGKVYSSLGLYDTAIPMLEKTVEMRLRTLGTGNDDTLEAIYHLGSLYTLQGRAQDGERLHREVLEARTRLFGPDDERTLAAANGLAGDLRYQGRYPEEEAMRRDLIARRTRTLGAADTATLVSERDLASTLWRERRQQEAEAQMKPVLASLRTSAGEDHPETIKTMHMLATVEYALRNFPESEALFREALER